MRPACTGVAAVWCPAHGDCGCDLSKPGAEMNDPACPLHSPTSHHAGAPTIELEAGHYLGEYEPLDGRPSESRSLVVPFVEWERYRRLVAQVEEIEAGWDRQIAAAKEPK